ncbi:MAG: hypothetical protein WDW38_003997 [Sanguina aurantia]
MPKNWLCIALLLFVGATPFTSLLEARHSLSTGDIITLPGGGNTLSSQFATGSSGLYLPLSIRHGFTKERGLLRNGTLPIQGAIREVGYFYTTLSLGTPARTFSLIIDTGSTITYVPCVDCQHCGKHTDEAFDPKQSNTSLRLGCSHPKCQCGSPSCQCAKEQCYYSRSYAEKSSSEGWLVEDLFTFPDQQAQTKVVFGCENGETGEIYRQAADGILGMGNNENAFQSQLVAAGVMEDVFGLCFGFPSGGTMTLGEISLPPSMITKYTPLSADRHMHYYNVRLDAITVAGVDIEIPASLFEVGYGSVLDSGTTFTYLPSAAFTAFSHAVNQHALAAGLKDAPGSDPQYKDICWKGAPEDLEQLGSVFPHVEFVFDQDMRLQLVPYRYLFLVGPGHLCLGVFDNGASGTLIGGITVRNVLVQYDRRNQRVGFTEANCANLGSDSLQITSPSPGAPVPPKDGPPASPAPADSEQQQQQPVAQADPQQAQDPAPQPSDQQQQDHFPIASVLILLAALLLVLGYASARAMRATHAEAASAHWVSEASPSDSDTAGLLGSRPG